MKLLKRNKPTEVLKHLSPKQSWLLKSNDLSVKNRTISQSLLGSFYLKNWLQCDCLADGPIMAIRHNSGGTFSLVTIHTHGLHAESCPLYTDPRNLTRPAAEMIEPENSFNFHKAISSNATKRPRTVTDSVSVRQNGLYRLLATLFVNSGLSNLASDSGFKECSEALANASNEIKLAGHNLSDHLFFGIEKFGEARSHLRSQNGNEWKHARPHAILIDVIDHVEKKEHGFHIVKHFSQSKTVEFDLYSKLTSIYLHSGRMSLRKGPFVLITTIANTTTEYGKTLTAPLRAYIAPVLSKSNWLIIDSDYERRVARKLQKSMEWFSTNRGLRSTVSKPLFYLETPEGPCLPDFLVCSEDHSIVLEVMGSHSVKYLERKNRTHKAMASIGDLVTFDAYAADKAKDFESQCFLFVKEALNYLI